MKQTSWKNLFIEFKRVELAGVMLLVVTILLWYQSAQYDLGTDKGYSRFNIDHQNDAFARTILTAAEPLRTKTLLRYVRNLKKAGYHTAAMTWLKYGAEQGFSDQAIMAYADALEPKDPASAAEWRKKVKTINQQRQR